VSKKLTTLFTASKLMIDFFDVMSLVIFIRNNLNISHLEQVIGYELSLINLKDLKGVAV